VKQKLVWFLIVIPIGILLLALAVVNREQVRLVLDPFAGPETGMAIQAPLFLLVLITLALGLLIGGFVTWIGQGKWRRQAKHKAKEAERWKTEAGRLEKELETLAEASPHAALPPE
jgi:uncharacterized integral membrane protein